MKTSKQFKVWVSLTSVFAILFTAVTIVTSAIPYIRNTFNTVFGGERMDYGENGNLPKYESDYTSKSEVLAAANDFNEKVCEEGFVLLKNEDNVLPITTDKKITVFGNNSKNIVLGGSGSNSGGSAGVGMISLYDSLADAGFTYNPVMKNFYENDSTERPQAPGMGSILTGFPIAETPVANYTTAVRNSYSDYNDLALVVLSRIGGEGFDLPRSMRWNGQTTKTYTTWPGSQKIPGARNETAHYLQLDQNETDMINEACSHFENVVVVINSANTLELGFLDDPSHYAYNSKIKGALWMGTPGNTGMAALGRILNGQVNPSGKTPDLYARNFVNDPTWQNFGNNIKADGNRYFCDKLRNAYTVEYEEGIYTGYRYYETRAKVEADKSNPTWYKENVVYPFGYGLSYTNFSWNVVAETANESNITGETQLNFTITVKNTGNKAGKDVVELYYTAPYKNGGIEKSEIVLHDFVKTDLLEPNESKDYTLSIKGRDMVSYDYNDANQNSFKGYELEDGKYTIKIMKDSHNIVQSFDYNVISSEQFANDETTNTPITNLFDDVSNHISTYLSRADFEGTWPTMMTSADLTVSSDFISSLTYKIDDKATDPWYAATAPKQASSEIAKNKIKVKFFDLIGLDYDDPLWDSLLNQLTVDQMWELIKTGEYKTAAIENISKPFTTDADGPMGFSIFMGDPRVNNTCYYAGEVVMAATFNEKLAYEMGKMVGNEGIIGYSNGDGVPYSGWYAPAMNLHRSQFGGRNFEYYSEDGVLSGKMATGVVKGTKEKGVYTYCKHLALNEQETNRDSSGLVTWANEQAMRENYFTPFEMVVKNGKTTAMMSSFNRIGTTWTGGCYNLLTQLLRKEWGFRGMVITDFNVNDYMSIDQMIRAGGDLSLSPDKKSKEKTISNTTIATLRQAAKNICYTIVNSNIVNVGGDFKILLPVWQVLLIVADALVVAGFGTWGALMFIKKKHFVVKQN